MPAKLVVASLNPVKLGAARDGFTKSFHKETCTVTGVEVPSGVSVQPMTSDETLQGALNRIAAAKELHPDADFWLGIEGGVEKAAHNNAMEVFAWIVVEAKDGKQGMSKTANFYLPRAVIECVDQGLELGHADDRVFGKSNSKQKTGSVGLLTNDLITRQTYYEHAAILAFIPFKNVQFDFPMPLPDHSSSRRFSALRNIRTKSDETVTFDRMALCRNVWPPTYVQAKVDPPQLSQALGLVMQQPVALWTPSAAAAALPSCRLDAHLVVVVDLGQGNATQIAQTWADSLAGDHAVMYVVRFSADSIASSLTPALEILQAATPKSQLYLVVSWPMLVYPAFVLSTLDSIHAKIDGIALNLQDLQRTDDLQALCRTFVQVANTQSRRPYRCIIDTSGNYPARQSLHRAIGTLPTNRSESAAVAYELWLTPPGTTNPLAGLFNPIEFAREFNDGYFVHELDAARIVLLDTPRLPVAVNHSGGKSAMIASLILVGVVGIFGFIVWFQRHRRRAIATTNPRDVKIEPSISASQEPPQMSKPSILSRHFPWRRALPPIQALSDAQVSQETPSIPTTETLPLSKSKETSSPNSPQPTAQHPAELTDSSEEKPKQLCIRETPPTSRSSPADEMMSLPPSSSSPSSNETLSIKPPSPVRCASVVQPSVPKSPTYWYPQSAF
ncbi:hypothetical protein LEN26_014602 [Aphanomyces euteiches]|nr:hypothetical protein LEN26_014602 [Aphanomyces euteiches]